MNIYEIAKQLKADGYKVQYPSTDTHNEAIFAEINGKSMNIDCDAEYDDVIDRIKALGDSEVRGERLSHGGHRPGAGRPATGANPTRTYRLSDEENEKVREFIKNMREAKKMDKKMVVCTNCKNCSADINKPFTTKFCYEYQRNCAGKDAIDCKHFDPRNI